MVLDATPKRIEKYENGKNLVEKIKNNLLLCDECVRAHISQILLPPLEWYSVQGTQQFSEQQCRRSPLCKHTIYPEENSIRFSFHLHVIQNSTINNNNLSVCVYAGEGGALRVACIGNEKEAKTT